MSKGENVLDTLACQKTGSHEHYRQMNVFLFTTKYQESPCIKSV